jgi:hypothetical protein
MAQLRPITKSSQQPNALRRSERLAELAWQSLIAEAELTPNRDWLMVEGQDLIRISPST